MKIIKKIPMKWFTLVDDIEQPNFIYFGKIQDKYNYKSNQYSPYTNKHYKYGTGVGYFPLQESYNTYVIRMKFKVLTTVYKGFFVLQEKDNEDYLQERYCGDTYDVYSMPKFSSQDFFEFFECVQKGEIKPEDGYFECNLRITKKTDNYFVKYYPEDNE